MPAFRKVAAELAPEPARAEVGQTYDSLLAGFAAGEWGQVELAESERRVVVRARLQAAAKRRGLALRFRPGPGPMIFCVEQATSSTSPTTASPVTDTGGGLADLADRPGRAEVGIIYLTLRRCGECGKFGGLAALQTSFFSGAAEAAPPPHRKRDILGRRSLPKPLLSVR